MHDEKIWALDTDNDKFMITGGGDSTLKVWRDNTIEKELDDKEKNLQKIMDE